MTSSSGAKRRHLASSPFQSQPEPLIEEFAVGDRASHDTFGVGRVIRTDPGAVIVDFSTQTVRIVSPFHKLHKL